MTTFTEETISPIDASTFGDAHCPLCGGQERVVYRGHPGYIGSKLYDIVYCSACNASHADPLLSDGDLYNLIYENADKVPGYKFYHKLARQVLSAKDPLTFLAEASPIYWGIHEYFKSKPHTETLRVLDFGCGLGYLTYSLSKRGINCLGADISQDAIQKATARYGDFYTSSNVLSDPDQNGKFDAIVCTELIEHVEQPKEFLESIRRLLAPGGELVLTTPNRSAYPANSLWSTDAPPVHLWWLSETAIERLSENCGFSSCRFIDLTASPNAVRPPSPHVDRSKPITSPIFDADGKLRTSIKSQVKSTLVAFLESTGLMPVVRGIYAKLRPHASSGTEQAKPKSRYLCAVLTNETVVSR